MNKNSIDYIKEIVLEGWDFSLNTYNFFNKDNPNIYATIEKSFIKTYEDTAVGKDINKVIKKSYKKWKKLRKILQKNKVIPNAEITKYIFGCECSSIRDSVIFSLWDNDELPEMTVHTYMFPGTNIFKRILKAVQYIFRIPRKYGDFSETVLEYKDVDRLISCLKRFKKSYEKSKYGKNKALEIKSKGKSNA